MIYFITNRRHPVTYIRSDISQLLEWLKDKDEVQVDTETSSLDWYSGQLLLISIGDKSDQFVIDAVDFDLSLLKPLEEKKVIGHNFTFDYYWFASRGLRLRKIYDTLIAEQRIRKGILSEGNSLDKVAKRRIGVDLSKAVRNEFAGFNRNNFFEDRHIKYSAIDVTHLQDIKEAQLTFIRRYHLEFMLNMIEFPLISVLGDACVRGFRFDRDQWMNTYFNNLQERNASEARLDDIIRSMGLRYDGYKLTGKFTRERNKVISQQIDIFGGTTTVISENADHINYTSSKQILEIFELAGVKPPVAYSKAKGEETETVGADALEQWLYENYGNVLYDFVKELLIFKEYDKKCGTFGEEYMKRFVRDNGRIYTWYNICSTHTGRLSSGNTDGGFINSQQIPKSNEFRHAFIADPGYTIMTIDLAGAELIILGSLAKDTKLLELQSQDIHSYLATAVYKELLSRDTPVSILCGYMSTQYHTATEEEIVSIRENLDEFKISKENRKDIRDKFKNVVYGTAYGAGAKKISETLGVMEMHGEVALDVLKRELPATFTYLEDNAVKGLNEGRIVFNTRTNTFRWFEPVVRKTRITPKDKGAIQRYSKNSPIQGTQSDMVKEAIIEVSKKVPDAELLLQVHDEGVYQIPSSRVNELSLQIQTIWEETASKYLDGFKMSSSMDLLPYWNK